MPKYKSRTNKQMCAKKASKMIKSHIKSADEIKGCSSTRGGQTRFPHGFSCGHYSQLYCHNINSKAVIKELSKKRQRRGKKCKFSRIISLEKSWEEKRRGPSRSCQCMNCMLNFKSQANEGRLNFNFFFASTHTITIKHCYHTRSSQDEQRPHCGRLNPLTLPEEEAPRSRNKNPSRVNLAYFHMRFSSVVKEEKNDEKNPHTHTHTHTHIE